MKQCYKCKELKRLDEFTPGQLKAKNNWCRSCVIIRNAENYKKDPEKYKIRTKTYTKNNKEKVRIRRAEYRKKNAKSLDALTQKWVENNRERSNQIKARWVINNPEKKQESANKWVRDNPDKANAQTAKRRAQKKKATPPWLTKKHLLEIREFYSLAKELQWLSEEPLHVDHIIPLVNENVSGLHVPWNLQILPKSLNIKKGNKI